ncbi:hypothetical protein [Bacillus sp. SBS7]|uniref:hypothetical protein n=1 Tax=Bacillus sp. SBS7 TaxID=3401756 RepID=UPI003AA97550
MIRYVVDTLHEYKDFFPFGSAMLGACTGGFITFMLTRSKDRKERKEKRLNSLFELQQLNFKLIRSLTDLELKLSVYISAQQEIEGYNVETINETVQKCLDELADARVVSLGNAIHINGEVFKAVSVGQAEVMKLFVPVTVQNKFIDNGRLKVYSQDNLIAVQNTFKKIVYLQDMLMQQERKYVNQYINKYVNEMEIFDRLKRSIQ